jgi:PilZ domain
MAAARLVEESAVEMRSAFGDVEVWTISSSGATVRASAPRLQVAAEGILTCRIAVDGVPHAVTVRVEEAEPRSSARAALVLRVLAAEPDEIRRAAPRAEIALRATLSAVACDRIVPGEPVVGHLADVSRTGFGARVADGRIRHNDRLDFHCRTLDGEIRCSARVKHVQPTGQPGEWRIGCSFIDPSPAVQATLDRLVARGTEPAAPASASAISLARSLAEPSPEPPVRRRPIALSPLARPGAA